MAEAKLPTYSDEQVATKIREPGLEGWYLEEGWLRRKYNTDG
jgi:4a-hydroxytetrahydrobiopterin dehydratase